MSSGMEPEVKQFFQKIISTLSLGLLWLATTVAAGLYYRLAWDTGKPLVFRILFYVYAVASLLWLLWYYYRIWKK